MRGTGKSHLRYTSMELHRNLNMNKDYPVITVGIRCKKNDFPPSKNPNGKTTATSNFG